MMIRIVYVKGVMVDYLCDSLAFIVQFDYTGISFKVQIILPGLNLFTFDEFFFPKKVFDEDSSQNDLWLAGRADCVEQ